MLMTKICWSQNAYCTRIYHFRIPSISRFGQFVQRFLKLNKWSELTNRYCAD
jgi:hypothetical protein